MKAYLEITDHISVNKPLNFAKKREKFKNEGKLTIINNLLVI